MGRINEMIDEGAQVKDRIYKVLDRKELSQQLEL